MLTAFPVSGKEKDLHFEVRVLSTLALTLHTVTLFLINSDNIAAGTLFLINSCQHHYWNSLSNELLTTSLLELSNKLLTTSLLELSFL